MKDVVLLEQSGFCEIPFDRDCGFCDEREGVMLIHTNGYSFICQKCASKLKQ